MLEVTLGIRCGNGHLFQIEGTGPGFTTLYRDGDCTVIDRPTWSIVGPMGDSSFTLLVNCPYPGCTNYSRSSLAPVRP